MESIRLILLFVFIIAFTNLLLACGDQATPINPPNTVLASNDNGINTDACGSDKDVPLTYLSEEVARKVQEFGGEVDVKLVKIEANGKQSTEEINKKGLSVTIPAHTQMTGSWASTKDGDKSQAILTLKFTSCTNQNSTVQSEPPTIAQPIVPTAQMQPHTLAPTVPAASTIAVTSSQSLSDPEYSDGAGLKGIQKTLKFTIGQNEVISGQGVSLTYASKLYYQCAAFIFIGPGTYEFTLYDGVWKKFRNVTGSWFNQLLDIEVESLNTVETSRKFCTYVYAVKVTPQNGVVVTDRKAP